jgi:hypothetical protein
LAALTKKPGFVEQAYTLVSPLKRGDMVMDGPLLVLRLRSYLTMQ